MRYTKSVMAYLSVKNDNCIVKIKMNKKMVNSLPEVR